MFEPRRINLVFTTCLFIISACSQSSSEPEAPILISIEIADHITFTSENVSDKDLVLMVSESSVSRPEDDYKFAGHLMYQFKDCEGQIIDVGLGHGWWTIWAFRSQADPVASEIFPKGEIRTTSIGKIGAWRAEHACEGKYQLSYFADGEIIAIETDWIQLDMMENKK